jgi:uncharacterized RDD family membrane protein YckC
VSCPSCGSLVPAGQERCPACSASVAPVTEGALAPDPAARPRPEPLREIPGLKKKERTWKDEVRDRVRDRKRRRVGDGELPLFRDEGEGEESAEGSAAGEETEGLMAGSSEAGLASPIELGADEPDLPLRPPAPASPSRTPDLRLSATEAAPREAAPRDVTVRPPIVPRDPPSGRAHVDPERPPLEEDEWTLGAEPSPADPRPVERPAQSGERARAAALDLALVGVMWAVVVYFASRAAHVDLIGLKPAWRYLAGYLAFLGLTYAGYFTGTTGQTLGKIATGLRVVDAAGRPPGYLRAFARAALGSLGVVAAGAGLIPMLLDPARRAFHDRVARTRVVKN